MVADLDISPACGMRVGQVASLRRSPEGIRQLLGKGLCVQEECHPGHRWRRLEGRSRPRSVHARTGRVSRHQLGSGERGPQSSGERHAARRGRARRGTPRPRRWPGRSHRPGSRPEAKIVLFSALPAAAAVGPGEPDAVLERGIGLKDLTQSLNDLFQPAAVGTVATPPLAAARLRPSTSPTPASAPPPPVTDEPRRRPFLVLAAAAAAMILLVFVVARNFPRTRLPSGRAASLDRARDRSAEQPRRRGQRQRLHPRPAQQRRRRSAVP